MSSKNQRGLTAYVDSSTFRGKKLNYLIRDASLNLGSLIKMKIVCSKSPFYRIKKLYDSLGVDQ